MLRKISFHIIRFSAGKVKLQIDDIISEKATNYGKNGEEPQQVFKASAIATGSLENDML